MHDGHAIKLLSFFILRPCSRSTPLLRCLALPNMKDRSFIRGRQFAYYQPRLHWCPCRAGSPA
jgi:hypothetical protein